MLTKKEPESSEIYKCINCDYYTSRYSQYKRHLATAKHKNKHFLTSFNKKSSLPIMHFCCDFCDKIYKSRVGLWYHTKKCEKNDVPVNDNTFSTDETKITPQMFYDLLKQNNELQKSLIEMANKQTIGNHNTVNSNNKTFNLHVFLNETCKDAINLTDFINQLQVSFKDLEDTGKLGYVEGISNVFLKNLKDIDYTRRPIHCSDSKRETIYIKDDNQWSRDDNQKTNMKKAIKQVASKNMRKISEWQQINPEYKDPESKINDQYMQIVFNSMSGSTIEESEKNYEKIVKNIVKETIIDK
jgi:hypothetical protein